MDSRFPLSRRSFLAGSVTTAASLAWAEKLFGDKDDASTKPAPALEKLGAVAIAEAKRNGATYCDIRINAYRDQYCGYRLSPQRGGSKVDEVPWVSDNQSSGFGVRVISKGQWGFAASPVVTSEEIARIAREAVTVANANAVLQAQPVRLAPVKGYIDRWVSPFEKDPF
jgi:TldD protein